MTYDATSPILGVGTATPAQIEAWFAAKAPGYVEDFAPDKRYRPAPAIGNSLVGYCRQWGVNWDLAAAQCLKESAAWQSGIARDKRNPAGLGAENSDSTGTAYDKAITFDTPDLGIRAQVAHLCDYAKGRGDWTSYDPRAAAMPAASFGIAGTISGLDGRWATPGRGYGADIARLANDLLAFAQQNGGTPVVDISGFTPPAIVDQWFPVNGVSYLGEDMRMRGVCIHQTGNTDPGADARQNVAYMNSRECIQRQASWHDTVGLDIIIRTIPHNRQGYHASDGDGPGNTTRAGIEGVMCYPAGSAEYERVMMNHAWYAAKSLRDEGLPLTMNAGAAGTLGQHHDFARDAKDCPQWYRDHPGEWARFCAYARAFYDRDEWAQPAAPARPDALILPGNPHGDVPIVLGFKAFIETLAAARYPQDLNAAVLSLVGYPEAPEYAGADGNSYQVFERTILQWNPNNQPPFDVVMLRREDAPPEEKAA